MNLSLWQIIKHGGAAMWVILGCSVIVLAVAIERAVVLWAFMDRARALADTVNRCLSRGAVAEARTACERSKSPLADVLLVGFERMGRSSREVLEASVDRKRQQLMLDLRSRLWILGTVGATAPFVGLYGTVVGIMGAMRALSGKTGAGFAVVAGPIAEALVATAAGIAVAVEAVVVFNFFNQRLGRTAVEVKLLVDEFLETVREHGVGGDPAPRAGESGEPHKGDGDKGARNGKAAVARADAEGVA